MCAGHRKDNDANGGVDSDKPSALSWQEWQNAEKDSICEETSPQPPQVEQPNDQDLSGVVSFGKHRGSSFQEVIDSDAPYCNWVKQAADKDDAVAGLREFAAWLKQGAQDNLEKVVHSSEVTSKSASGSSKSSSGSSWHSDPVTSSGTVCFGKYTGESFESVLEKDPMYCSWVKEAANKADASHEMKLFAAFLQKNPPPISTRTGSSRWTASESRATDPSDMSPLSSGRWKVTFGKYKGKTFEEICSENPGGYCDWLVDQILQSPHSKVKQTNSLALASYVLWKRSQGKA